MESQREGAEVAYPENNSENPEILPEEKADTLKQRTLKTRENFVYKQPEKYIEQN